MAHQSHIKSEKYRQWVKAGLGLGYLKEGLAPFCVDVAKQQHKDILDNIKRTKHIPTVLCGACTLKTLQPDHVKIGKKQCPLHHTNCNCCYTSGKTPCPNNVCGAIYDSIITYHASKPPAPNWKNTQSQQWIADPWSITKCFINAPGYAHKASATDTDCTGLLHVVINNKYFHNHVSCNMTGPNIFSKVRQYRNEIFHSSTMELDSPKTDGYIDDMIAVLHDSQELIHRPYAQEAVQKLQDLKQNDFIITTEHVEKVLEQIKEDLSLIKETTKELAEDNADLKQKVAGLESKISELIEVISILKEDSTKETTNFDKSKTDLREKLIKEYTENLLQVPIMPCQPEQVCNVQEVYVTPTITIKSKDKDRQEIETEVKTMSDIFIKDGKRLKSIYVLGEAGSGKSSFCKSMIQCWCMAHTTTPELQGKSVNRQNVKGLITEDCDNEIKEMETFKFLFFLPLRQDRNEKTIKEMLEEEYDHPVLKELLERESETCLIMLDGLDEWASTTTSPPKQAKFSNYTVLTTSRLWKIGSLDIGDNKIQQRIYIKGLDKTSKMMMIENTVKRLNESFKKNKDPNSCKNELANRPFNSLGNTAMMVQQLICLWFDDRLHVTSKCDLYTCMITLLFIWYDLKVPNDNLFEDMKRKSRGIKLPEYLEMAETCQSYSYIIRDMSKLAYETLIKGAKETSLTFESSIFEQLDILDETKLCCLKVGLLSEEKFPSLSASRSRKSHISFIHKSVQEYLAAVYIVLNITTKQESSLDIESGDISDYLSQRLNVKTIDEVLEQENVLTMLCGLEPRLAKHISKLICDIVETDDRVLKHRTTIGYKYNYLIFNIQKLVLDCIKETESRNTLFQFSFGLRDLIFDQNKEFHLFGFIEHSIILKSVFISFRSNMRKNEEYYDGTLNFITKCRNLEAIKLVVSNFDTEVHQRICDSIESNASTLKCVSVKYFGLTQLLSNLSRRPTFRRIANMNHLVVLHVENFTVGHEDFECLCTFLSGTGNLQHISVGIECECNQQHKVDLSKHKQLQLLEYGYPVVVTNSVCTNLEKIRCFKVNRIYCINILDFFSNSKKIKRMHIDCDSSYIPNLFEPLDCDTLITSKLTHFISLLQQLRELTLRKFTFTDNIIPCPSEIKCLETIHLSYGTMSLTTWRKFVDSVAELAQRVEVRLFSMCIARDGEKLNPDMIWTTGGGEEAAALHYVREHEALFDVLYEDKNSITFSTKK